MNELRFTEHGLVRRIATWVAVSTIVSLCVFATIAYIIVVVEEQQEPQHDSDEQIQLEARKEVGNAMLIAAPIGVLLAVAGAAVATRHALKPLDHVIGTAAKITARQLDQRLPVPKTNDEVRALVLTLNDLLERLESGFAALDRFATDASHELRTPLTVIATELEVLLQKPRSSPEWERCARVCLDEARHLARLVGSLLDVARTERAVDLDGTQSELQLIVERALAAVGPRADAHGVAVVADVTDLRAHMVRGDSNALTSALLNVIDNAVQYTPAGGRVRIWTDASRDDALALHVDDSGPGVASEEWEHIFEPFARGRVGHARTGGFGLGLAISRRICDHHQVALRVGRSPLGGARFSFEFSVHGVA